MLLLSARLRFVSLISSNIVMKAFKKLSECGKNFVSKLAVDEDDALLVEQIIRRQSSMQPLPAAFNMFQTLHQVLQRLFNEKHSEEEFNKENAK